MASQASEWIKVSPSSGSGNGTITVTVTINDTGAQRTGYIVVEDSSSTLNVSVLDKLPDGVEVTDTLELRRGGEL